MGAPVGHQQVPKVGPHAGSRGGTVVSDTHGLVVVERNAGALIRADREGNAVAKLELHEGLGQLVTDGKGTVFVADRRGDRVVVVDATDPTSLVQREEFAVGDPHGLALSPDGATLYVTSSRDHQLVAVGVDGLKEQWRADLRAEPRGVAVAADGKEATVGFLSAGTLAIIDLTSRGETIRWRSLNPRDRVEVDEELDDWGEGMISVATVREARSRFEVPTDTGRRRVSNVFNVAYVGHGLVVAPHQLSTPQMKRIPSSQMQDSYGGGPEQVPAIVHRLAMLRNPGQEDARTAFSKLRLHQPRAMAYAVDSDTLYLAGYGDDRIVAVADVSQPTSYVAWALNPRAKTGKKACGPDGLAVDGDDVWVHCELSRKLIRLTPDRFDLDDVEWKAEKAGVTVGPELAASLRSDEVERGAELFRRGEDWRISDSGVMACASCHPEGRQDGLSWRLGKSILQTPMLAGRVVGTAPYKWGGGDKNLKKSFQHTIERLGGRPEEISNKDFAALVAYVESLPRPAAPAVTDAAAVARGRKIFNGDLDCITCHNGDKLTDGSQYPFGSRGLEETDTPSLVGLAHTAPYYHDGSATDLYALLTDKGNVHDMADFSTLKGEQIGDLIAYLESL
ncbi:MAG: c-type cytochrome [Myxococcota bacterium]